LSNHYDVVVIGGGIQGAGVAQAAVAEGYSVLVLEKSGLGDGTSSKSSKLIHGGLRYLESLELSLVRECLRERAILLKIAPDLVKMRRFHIPIYEDTRRPCIHINAGLMLYYALANFRSDAKPGSVDRGDWDKLDGLSTTNLKKVFYYSDAQTDDRLLTQAVMASAESFGAEVKCPAAFLRAKVQGSRSEINYMQDGEQHQCTASVLVNAAGPWVNDVAKKVSPALPAQSIELVAGTHILIDGSLDQGIYYTESPRDGRAVFVMPWNGKTLVGTTERSFRAIPDLIRPSRSEQNYLLSVLRHYFPAYENLTSNDVVDSFAGLRVLPKADGHAFHRSREVIYKTDAKKNPRVLSIYGGKLTAYRATAQNVMKRIRSSLPSKTRRGHTEKMILQPPS